MALWLVCHCCNVSTGTERDVCVIWYCDIHRRRGKAFKVDSRLDEVWWKAMEKEGGPANMWQRYDEMVEKLKKEGEDEGSAHRAAVIAGVVQATKSEGGRQEMWMILKKKREKGRNKIPQMFWVDREGAGVRLGENRVLVGDSEGMQRAWGKVFGRTKHDLRKIERDEGWNREEYEKKRKYLQTWEAKTRKQWELAGRGRRKMQTHTEMAEEEDSGTDYEREMDSDEFEEQWKRISKGAPGEDMVGRNEMVYSGEYGKIAVRRLTDEAWNEEVMAQQAVDEVSTPVHKKGSRYVTTNYRPVSLTSKMTLVRGVYLDRQRKWRRKVKHGGMMGSHEASFGAVKGRGREMMILGLKESACSEMFRERERGVTTPRVIIGKNDAAKAYPFLPLTNADIKMVQEKVPPKLVRMRRAMHKKMNGKVQVEDYKTRQGEHAGGANQGTKDASDSWNEYFEDVVTGAGYKEKSTRSEIRDEEENKDMGKYTYVDDYVMTMKIRGGEPCGGVSDLRLDMRRYEKRKRLRWGWGGKFEVLLVGTKVYNLKWEGWQGEEEESVQEVTVLGEVVEWNLYRGMKQAEITRKRAAAAVRSLTWLGGSDKGVTLDTYKLLLET